MHSRNQGDHAIEAVKVAIERRQPFSIVFLDSCMPPGIDGIAAAKQIREIDANVNIVIVTDSLDSDPDNLGKRIPPADKVFIFKKPFHGAECRQLAAALCGKWHSDRALRKANEDLERRVEERTEALQKIAYFDLVTRLPNQLLLIEELKNLISKASRQSKGRQRLAFGLRMWEQGDNLGGHSMLSLTHLVQELTRMMTW